MFNRQKITKVAYLLLLGLLISIDMACLYPPQEISPSRIKEIQSSVVTIRLFDKGGNQIREASGFFINEARDVLSASCVFLNPTTRAEIVTSQGGIYPVKNIVEPNNPTWDDAATLSVDLPAGTIKPIVLTSNLPSEGERIRVIDSHHIEYGSVTRSSTGSLAITFPIESWTFAEGAAVVNMNGEVFGVMGCENPSEVGPPYTRIVIGVLTKDNISKLAHVEARTFRERYESKPAHVKGPTSGEEYALLRNQKEQEEAKRSEVRSQREFMHGKTKIVISERLDEGNDLIGSYWLAPYLLKYNLEITVDDKIITQEESMGNISGIKGAGISDLDGDNNVEIFIYWHAVGTGGYMTLHFYELVGNQLILRYKRDLDPQSASFEIIEPHFVYKYQMSNAGDPNCCPTGETLMVKYAFKNDEFVEVERSIIKEN